MEENDRKRIPLIISNAVLCCAVLFDRRYYFRLSISCSSHLLLVYLSNTNTTKMIITATATNRNLLYRSLCALVRFVIHEIHLFILFISFGRKTVGIFFSAYFTLYYSRSSCSRSSATDLGKQT